MLLAAAVGLLIVAREGGAHPARNATTEDAAAAAGRAVPVPTSTDAPDWAPRGTPSTAAASPVAATPTAPLFRKPISELANADSRVGFTLPEDGSADAAAHGSGRRYVTRQLAHELTVAAPYALVIDADDEAALETGLQAAETVSTYAGGKAMCRIFVRSRQPALAARLAERLTAEQGWVHVFVVI